MSEEQKLNEQDRLKALNIILDRTFTFNIIMNDVFAGAADAEEFSVDDLPTMIPILCQFGDNALIAYAAVKRGIDPKAEMPSSYWEAKKIIEFCKANDEWFMR